MNDAYPLQNPWGNAGFQPWIYMRYAEVLLNFAEAANEAYGADVIPAGATLSARSAINMVRSRAGVNMPPLAPGLNKSQMQDAVRYERRVELAFEEHRFYDVRRWKIANVTENKPAGGDYHNQKCEWKFFIYAKGSFRRSCFLSQTLLVAYTTYRDTGI
jgi:hypothetical protein